MGVIDFSNVMSDKRAYLSSDEINRMLQYLWDNERVRDYVLITVLAHTGRRISEIVGKKPYTINVGLRPCDLMEDGLIEWDILKKNHVKIRSNKGIVRQASAVLKDRKNKRPKRLLIAGDDYLIALLEWYADEKNIGRFERFFPITDRRVRYIVASVAKKVGIFREGHGIHPHMFRHGLGVNYLKDNPNNPYALLHLQRILAHSSINVTTGYAQFSQEDIRTGLNKLFKNKKR